MTDGIMFCHLKSHLKKWGVKIGAMSVAPLGDPNGSLGDDAATAAVVGRGDGEGMVGDDTSTTRSGLRADSGQV